MKTLIQKMAIFLMLFIHFLPGNSYNLPPTSNLVIHIPFEDNFEDVSSNKVQTILMGTGTPAYKKGAVGNGIEYNVGFPYGALNANYIKILNSQFTQLGEEYTFSIWAKKYSSMSQSNLDCSGRIIGNTILANLISLGGNWENGINFLYIDNDIMVENGRGANNPGRVVVPKLIDLNMWGHYVLTQDAKGMRIYKNGTRCHEMGPLYTGTANTRDLIIGPENGSGSCLPSWYPIDGMIDDFRFYNTSISDEEVLALYQLNNDFSSPNDPSACFASLDKSLIKVNGQIIDNEAKLNITFLKECEGNFTISAFIGSQENLPLYNLKIDSSSNKTFISTSFETSEIEKFRCVRSINEYFKTDNCSIFIKIDSDLGTIFLYSIDLIIQTDLRFNTTIIWKNTFKEVPLGETVVRDQNVNFDSALYKNNEVFGENSTFSVIDTLDISLSKKNTSELPPNATPVLIKAIGGSMDTNITFNIDNDIILKSSLGETWVYSVRLDKFSGKSFIELQFKIQISPNNSRLLTFKTSDTTEPINKLEFHFYVIPVNDSVGDSVKILYYSFIPITAFLIVALFVFHLLRKYKQSKNLGNKSGFKLTKIIEKEEVKNCI